MNSFTELSQMNVDHYNDHPVAHTALAVGGLVAGIVMARKICRKIVEHNEITIDSIHSEPI
jgi:hypothetical protein